MNRARHKHNARLGEQCVLFAENADFSAQKSVFLLQIYGSFGGCDIKKWGQGEQKGYNLKYRYIIEY